MSNGTGAPKFLTAHQVSDRWQGQIATGTLANWRSKNIGPRFVKFRSRVLYRISDIEAWENEQEGLLTA